MKKIIISLLCVGVGTVFILDSSGIKLAAIDSVTLCFNTIIPSLFAFMALSDFVITSGLHRFIFAPLYFIMKPILKLSREDFAIFVLSMVGGYPIGAKLLCDRKPETKPNPSSLIIYCYCGSPKYILLYIK